MKASKPGQIDHSAIWPDVPDQAVAPIYPDESSYPEPEGPLEWPKLRPNELCGGPIRVYRVGGPLSWDADEVRPQAQEDQTDRPQA